MAYDLFDTFSSKANKYDANSVSKVIETIFQILIVKVRASNTFLKALKRTNINVTS